MAAAGHGLSTQSSADPSWGSVGLCWRTLPAPGTQQGLQDALSLCPEATGTWGRKGEKDEKAPAVAPVSVVYEQC